MPHHGRPMTQCGPIPEVGSWSCETCGQVYPYPLWHGCPGKSPEAAVGDVPAAEQLARLKVCQACPECHQGDGALPHCPLDRTAPEQTICSLAAIFQRRVRTGEPACLREQ